MVTCSHSRCDNTMNRHAGEASIVHPCTAIYFHFIFIRHSRRLPHVVWSTARDVSWIQKSLKIASSIRPNKGHRFFWRRFGFFVLTTKYFIYHQREVKQVQRCSAHFLGSTRTCDITDHLCTMRGLTSMNSRDPAGIASAGCVDAGVTLQT